MRVLVTGAAGFIGHHLVKSLIDKGDEVIGIDNLSAGTKDCIHPAMSFVEADIRNPDCDRYYANIEAVFHLAAKNCLHDCELDKPEAYSVNVVGTEKVLEACKKYRVKRIFVAESSAVYEGYSSREPIAEVEPKPISYYAVTKAFVNEMVTEWNATHKVGITSLRYFNVYGVGQDYRRTHPPVMSSFILNMLRSNPVTIYGDGSQSRDFIHVDDVNAFHIAAMHDDRTIGQVYNLGTGKAVTIIELYLRLSSVLGYKQEPIHIAREGYDIDMTLANIDKALALGWQPKVELGPGLEGMIEALRKVA